MVPASRATLGYLLRRPFRMGNTLAMIGRIEGGKGRIALRAPKGVGRIGLGVAQMATALSEGRAGPAAALCTIAWGEGALAGVLGLTYREYHGVPGSAADLGLRLMAPGGSQGDVGAQMGPAK